MGSKQLHWTERSDVNEEEIQPAGVSQTKAERGFRRFTSDLREWRGLRARVASFPEQVEEKIQALEDSLSEYRLVISGLDYKAPDTDQRVWDLYDHIQTEKQRLVTEMERRPLFLRGLKELRSLNDAWEKLLADQQALKEMISRAPAELIEYNERQLERERQRQEEQRRADLYARIAAARRSLDLALGYIEQLDREGRVTFGSQVLQLEEAQKYWIDHLNQILRKNEAGELHPDEVVLNIYNLESMIRDAPNLSMRVREVEERFTRLVTKHDMLVSFGKTVISQQEIARMTIKLHEQIPELWITGQRQELERAMEVLESFVATYESTIETELAYLERRRPGLTRALATVSDGDETALLQMSAMARSLISAIDSRDRYMRGHSDVVSRLVVKMARNAGWNKTDIDYLMIAALLHDVGKVSIPEHILNKTDPLTEDEWQTIQMHPYYGAQILKPVDSLSRIIPWIYHHQERWDGRGYPDHLTGRQIPIPASYIAVAEAFSVMTVDLPNRPAKSKEEAIEELRKAAETQFSPDAVEVLADVVAKEKKQTQPESD